MAGINPYYRRKVRVQKLGFKELEGVLKNEGTVRVSYKDGSAFLWDTAQDFSSVAIPSGATGKGTRRYKAYIFDASGYVISGFCDIEDTNYAVGADVVVNGTFAANAVGADVVVNGTFAADSDWVKGTGWTIADGKAAKAAGEASNLTASAAVANIAQGGLYLVNVKVACTAPGTIVVKAGNTNVGSISCVVAEEANFSFFYTEPTGNVKPTIFADQNFAGTIDDLQFKQVTHQNPNVAIQLFASQVGGAQNIEGTVSIVPLQFDPNSALTYKIVPLF